MKGFQDIKNLVEVDKAWDEQLGLAVGVSIAEDIYPKRIEGIKRFDTYRMEILRGRIGVGIIQDRRLSWDCGPKSNAVMESGRYFSYSEIEKFRNFIVIEGMMIPPNFFRFIPDYDRYGISCEIYDKDGQLISKMDDCESEDQAIFKSIKVNSLYDDFSSTRKKLFSCVFGFSGIVKPSKIKIIPQKSSRYPIGCNFSVWEINDDIFPRQNLDIITSPEMHLLSTQTEEMDETIDDDIPFC